MAIISYVTLGRWLVLKGTLILKQSQIFLWCISSTLRISCLSHIFEQWSQTNYLQLCFTQITFSTTGRAVLSLNAKIRASSIRPSSQINMYYLQEIDFDVYEISLWTVSSITPSYIRNFFRRFSVYITNRLHELNVKCFIPGTKPC